MKYTIIAITILLLTIPSCKKTNIEDQLPPETHEGNFTFGCKVDGKIYTASGKDGGIGLFGPRTHVNYYLNASDSVIIISAENFSANPNFSFDLTIHFLRTNETCLMKAYPYNGIFNNHISDIKDSSGIFSTTNKYTGSMTINYFDGSYIPYNHGTILAGTFEMDAVNTNGKVIHITEGRFDIGQ